MVARRPDYPASASEAIVVTSSTNRRLTVVVNGTPHVVEVDKGRTPPTTIRVDGRPYQVSIEPTPANEPSGAPMSSTFRAGTAAAQVRAPMPGSILTLLVRAGDTVAAGQQLCVLEAMKMKNAIRASRDGVIASVEVGEGQTVAYGDVLMTFE